MWKVSVKQDSNIVCFEFNKEADVLEFVETCMECGDSGTEITIKEEEE